MADATPWFESLGLTRDPFAPEPAQADFFFETPSLAGHLDTLVEVALAGNFIAIVKGEHGAGKTTLLQRLSERLQARAELDLLRIEGGQGGQLLQSLSEQLQMNLDAVTGEPVKSLINLLIELRNAGRTAVVLIDDAHLLSPYDLTLLLRLSLSTDPRKQGLLHTLLFAEPSLDAQLAATVKPLPRGRLFQLQLDPLDAEQSVDYLAHRLRAAGYEAPVPFGRSDLKHMYRQTQGLPAALNDWGIQALQRAHGSSWQRLANPLGRFGALQLGTAGVAAAVLAGLIVWWQVAWSPPAESNIEPQTALSTADTVATAPPPAAEPAAEITASAAPVEPTPPIDEPPDAELATEPTEPRPDSQNAAAASPVAEASNGAMRESQPTPPASDAGSPEEPVATEMAAIEALATQKEPTAPSAAADEDSQAEQPEAPGEREVESATATANATAEAGVTADTAANEESLRAPEEMPLRALKIPPPLTTVDLAQAESGDKSEENAPPASASQPADTATVAKAAKPNPPPASKPAAPAARRAPPATPNPPPESKPAAPKAQQTPPAKPPQASVAKAKPPAPPAAAPSKPAQTASREAEWLRQRQPDEYVVQLVAASRQQALQDFIARHRFPGTPLSFRTYSKGKTWYVLVLGPYQNRRQARAALAKLPAELQRYEPWARSVESLQAAVRR